MRQLKLLSRSYCHLCDDMIAAIDEWRANVAGGLTVNILDIDQYPALEKKWGDKVPVLLEGEVEICHYFLDLDRLNQHLAQTEEPG